MIKLIFIRDFTWYNPDTKENYYLKKGDIINGDKQIDDVYEIMLRQNGRYYHISFTSHYTLPLAEYRDKQIDSILNENEILQD